LVFEPAEGGAAESFSVTEDAVSDAPEAACCPHIVEDVTFRSPNEASVKSAA
jgi:hypothetical protein